MFWGIFLTEKLYIFLYIFSLKLYVFFNNFFLFFYRAFAYFVTIFFLTAAETGSFPATKKLARSNETL